jgi:serine protease Do
MNAGFGEVAESLRRSTVQVLTGHHGAGSGVIWDSAGLIITNAHVARDSRSRIELWDGRTFSATVVTRDPRRDLAALRIEAGSLPAAISGDSGALRVGELVVAIGNPFGFVGALTTGVVHALGPLRALGPQPWVQADVRLAPGNSGGPLADARGRVIGINTMIAGGLALAVPSNSVTRFLRHGATGIGLGVVIRPVQGGMLVLQVEPGSPAAISSLLMGDLIVGANGRALASPDDLQEAIANSQGGVLDIEFVRGDRRTRRHAAVRLQARSAEAA